MKGEHYERCLRDNPSCLCNTCKRDRLLRKCCYDLQIFCPVTDCEDFEPDDEEEGEN